MAASVERQGFTGGGATGGPIEPRIFRVHGSDYYGDEVTEALETHSDERLAAVAELGYDGVWLHVELRQLCPTSLFAPYEPDAPARLAALRHVVERAQRHGLKLWLYLNEPRCYPRSHPFWQTHPECQGHPGRDTAIAWRRGNDWLATYAMCVSSEPVQRYLRDAMRELATQVPMLGGAFAITASEHHTHCYSRVIRPELGGKEAMLCPRCRGRDPIEMPIAIGRALHAGLAEAGSALTLALWTWSWRTHIADDPQPKLIASLPQPIVLLADFERGEEIERLGKKLHVDEYAFAIVGPSQRFRQYAHEAAATGRPMWAKLQVGTTHELATVPNIPVPGVLYDKVEAVRQIGASGALASWSIGVRATLNSFAAGRLLRHAGELPERDAFLRELAQQYFGDALRDETLSQLCEGWQKFGDAMGQYPTSMEFVYFSPMNYAPAYPWTLQRTRTRMARSWTNEPWGDHLEMSARNFTLAEVATMLDVSATLWAEGLEPYERALAPLSATNRRAWEELSVARACGLFFRSGADCYAFAAAVERDAKREELHELIAREERTCRAVLPILEADERIGWHDETRDRMADPRKVKAKLAGLASLRETILTP